MRGKGFTNVELGAVNGSRLTTEIAYDPAQKAAADQLAPLFPGARLVEEPGSDGITVTLGRDYRPVPSTGIDSLGAAAAGPTAGPSDAPSGGPSGSPSATPSGMPTGIAENARGADTDPCADLTFG
ncbi:LytR C-terminal domain-containing protein [Kitasatospora aburaviensis]